MSRYNLPPKGWGYKPIAKTAKPKDPPPPPPKPSKGGPVSVK